MSNFENDNQNMGNMNFNNNQYISNEQIIELEFKEIKNLKKLTAFQSGIAIVGTISNIYYLILCFGLTSSLNYENIQNFYNIVLWTVIMTVLGTIINVAVLTLGIIMLIKNSKIKFIKVNKSLIMSSAILAIVSIIPIYGLINLATFIMSLICYFNLKNVVNNFKK